MFKAAVGNARTWKNLLSAISPLIEEGDFVVALEGITMRAMDPSHVAMVDFEYRKPAFKEYECTAPTKIRLNVTDIAKKLRGAGQDPLEMAYDEKTRKLTMVVKGKWTTTFTLPTLDSSGENVPIPKLEFKSKLKTTSAAFKEIIEQIQSVSNDVVLEATPDRITAETVTELSGAKIELDKGSEAVLGLEVKEASKSTYNLNYLAQVAAAGTQVAELVTVEFSTNMPIRLEYDISENGKLVYYVAPRIEPA